MRNLSKLFVLAVLLMGLLFVLTGCYVNEGVSSNEVGLRMGNGVSVDEVVGAGRYSNWGFFSGMEKIDVSAKTIMWEDPDLWTADKQPVQFKVSVTYARKRDKESVIHMWEMYNAEAKNDTALASLVTSRVPRVAKQVTTSMTLDQMLGIAADNQSVGGREKLQQLMFDLLQPELKEFDVDLLDVGVNDIGVDEEYASKLKEKAVSQVASELAEQKTKQLTEQIKQEKAQTDVSLEIARRANLVAEEENKIYQMNPEAFELERLKRLADVIGDSDKIYFVPEGTDLDVILSGSSNQIIPKTN